MSNPADLRFSQPAPGSPHLRFGETDVQTGVVVNANVSATLPGLSVSAQGRAFLLAEVSGTLPALTVDGSAQYRTQTQRPRVRQTETGWRVAAPTDTGTQAGHQDTRRLPVGWESVFQTTIKRGETFEHRLPDVLKPLDDRILGRFQDASKMRVSSTPQHQDTDRRRLCHFGRFQDATKRRGSTHFRHQDGDRTKRTSRLSPWGEGTPRRTGKGTRHQIASPLFKGWGARHQDARRPPVGTTVWVVPPPPPPPQCYTPNGHLLFSVLANSTTPHLVFVCDNYVAPPVDTTVVVPVRRVYIVINNLALRRVSDNATVPAFSFRLSLDVDSWAWGFSASLPASAQALVEPQDGPVELSAWVNGQEFRVLAEQVRRERSFGQATINISGRSRHATLDAPYAPTLVFDNTAGPRTHQQLFGEVLTVNGVPLGVSIDYGLDPWTVPAGVWSHQGTYISAIVHLAQAAGAYLIPHPSNMAFKVRHRYPVAPWEWSTATPDLVLPSAVVTREGTQWQEKPAYNRVFVSGQDQGVLGQVTRAGTPGDVLAPMVTDPLITDAVAARQRGLAVLGDTGRKIEHTLRLPVLPATGVVQPGTLVRYEDGPTTRVGIVRSTDVDAQMPDVWQTLGVEVHVDA